MEPSTTKTAWAEAASKGPRTLGEQAFDALHAAIINGDIAPGERLRIEETAEKLGMSHLPIREAIRRLESEALVAHVPHRGASVASLSLEDLRQLYLARLLLEPEIIAHSARNFTEQDVAVARRALERLTEAERDHEIAEIWAAHTDFHFALYRPSRATWMLHLVQPLWNSSQRYRMTIAPLSSKQRLREALGEHKQMLAACRGGHAERASLVLYNHLVKTANLITDQMDGEHVFDLR
jgi:DNA-binding GntR family transcriptional regulator